MNTRAHTIEEVAKSFCQSVECIESMRSRDLIAEILEAEVPCVDYDDVSFYYACKDLRLHDETFDVFVEFATDATAEERTPEQMLKLRSFMLSLAESVLIFNAGESSCQSSETMNALYDA